MAQSTKAGMAEESGAEMVPAVPWEDGRFPHQVVLPQTLVQHPLTVHQAVPAIQAVAADGSAEIMASGENPAQAVPGMWMALHLSPIKGSITLRKQRQA